MAFLFTVVGANISEKFELDSPGRNTYIIGRDADIRISDPAISNRHAELISLEGNWIVRDLGTPAGTFVNNKKLSAAIKLKDNDQVRCGSTILLFSQHIARPQPQKLEKTPELPVSRDQFDSTFVQAIDLALQEVQDPKELLARAAKALFQNEIIDCIYIVSKDGRSELQVALEIKRPGTDCVLYSGIVEQALADLKPVYVDEVSKYRSSRSVYHEGSLRCVAAVPVIAKNSVKSVLYIGSCKANAFANGYTAILGYNGWYLGLALENISLIQAAKQNQRLTEAGQTAANMSHTIKNIVQSIGGATEVIDYAFESGKFDRARNSWGILRKNLDRIRKFALDMLAFSRDSKAIFTDCMFNKIVESAIESLNSKAGEKGVSLALEMDESIPHGQMDVDKIHDVVLNLVMNAIDAVEENKGIIKVHTEYLTDKKMLRLSVKDNGPGIKPEDLDKVFLPFHTTKAKTGTGLGLAICKRVVEQHGGTITVESELGEGAAFTILLPVNEN